MSPTEMIRKSIDEHHALQNILTTTRRAMEAPPETDEWLPSVRDAFEHLRAHLIKHFAIEESEGYMRAVIERRPDKADQVKRMRDEHAVVAARADQIMSGLREARSLAASQATRVRDEIRGLLEQVHRHEDHENRLIQTVFNTDISVSD